MEKPEITGVALERIILDARSGNEEALNLLLSCQWFNQILKRIASLTWLQYKVDADKRGKLIRDVVSDALRNHLHNINPPKNKSWDKLIEAWCYEVAKNHCLNEKEHRNVEQNHVFSVEHENTQIIVHGIRKFAPGSTVPSQEEEIEMEERNSLWNSREMKLHRAVYEVFNSFTPEGKRIISRWAEGMTLHQISVETGVPLATVDRRLKKLQKPIVKVIRNILVEDAGEARAEKIGVAQLEENLKANRDGFKELIANSIREAARSGHVSYAGV